MNTLPSSRGTYLTRHAAPRNGCRPLVTFLAAGLLANCAHTQPPACLLPTQKPMTSIELFFGRSITGHPPVTDAQWSSFVATRIAPNFPDGFTVLDATGQWLDPGTHQSTQEASKVVRILAAPQAQNLAPRIDAITSAYKAQFMQTAVGVVTLEMCGAF